MITSPIFAGKRDAVLGLARSGLAAAEALLASGADVTAWDRQDVARDKLADRATIADPLEIDLTAFAGVVVSPGVPLNTHPIKAHAAKYGVPVIGDIELFALAQPDLPPHKVVGITGTNGKSTTTALIHHICETAGLPTLMGGNIGIPIMAQKALRTGGVYVLELSSYQIDLTYSLECAVAVLLNITPDHLDRYAGFDAYAGSKERLFSLLGKDGVGLVAGTDDASCDVLERQRAELGGDRMLDISAADAAGQSSWPALQGPHNLQNAIAAENTCQQLGIAQAAVEEGLRSFPGLPHRMEVVCETKGVLFVNDSKATNPASAAPALAAFPPSPLPRIHWIVGGLAKEDGLGECADHLGSVKAAYTIGESGPRFTELLGDHVPVRNCELLCEAVRSAVAAAEEGDVVLLAPACASFDQFRDYEARGEFFHTIVGAFTNCDAPDVIPIPGAQSA